MKKNKSEIRLWVAIVVIGVVGLIGWFKPDGESCHKPFLRAGSIVLQKSSASRFETIWILTKDLEKEPEFLEDIPGASRLEGNCFNDSYIELTWYSQNRVLYEAK